MKNIIKNFFIISTCLAISACGYNLRGALEIPSSIKSVSLVSTSYSSLVNSISMSLVASGIKVQSLPDRSLFRINIESETFDRRQLTISTTGRVNEYELITA